MRTAPGLACGSCTACCQNEQIKLAPGDDPGRYDLEVRADGIWIAARADGRPGCRYLGPRGCTIYASRPAACRAFDCRLYFLGKSPAEIDARLRVSPGTAKTFAAAIARLHTLPADAGPSDTNLPGSASAGLFKTPAWNIIPAEPRGRGD